MTRLNRSANCGNSPKNKMVEDIGIALEARDCEYIFTVLDSEAVWHCAGNITTSANKILDALITQDKPTALTIDHAMSHGKVGAVSGHTERGKGEQRFCHMIEFTSTKCARVKRIDSYCG